MSNVLFKLSPSDFKFLWEECKHCYYQKVVNNLSRPYSPFPAIFTQINSLIQGPLIGKNLITLHPDLPSGVIVKSEGWLESTPINNCFIKGKFDLLAKLEDGTYCVIDLKISNPKEDSIYKYGTQLHAYKYSLENPAKDEPIKVSRMGLLVIHPESVVYEEGMVILKNKPTWIEIKEDTESFGNFISEISDVLNSQIPEPSADCGVCNYRNSHINQTLPATEEKNDLPF